MNSRKGFLKALLYGDDAKASKSNHAAETKVSPFVPAFLVEPFKFEFSTKRQETPALPFELSPVPSSNAAITMMLSQSVPLPAPFMPLEQLANVQVNVGTTAAQIPSASESVSMQTSDPGPVAVNVPLPILEVKKQPAIESMVIKDNAVPALQPPPPLPFANINIEEELSMESGSKQGDSSSGLSSAVNGLALDSNSMGATSSDEQNNFSRSKPIEFIWKIKKSTKPRTKTPVAAKHSIKNQLTIPPHLAFVAQSAVNSLVNTGIGCPKQDESDAITMARNAALSLAQPAVSALPKERTEEDDYAEEAAKNQSWVESFLAQPRV